MMRHFLLLFLFFFTSIGLSARDSKARDSLDVMIGQMICIGIGHVQELGGDEAFLLDILEGKVGGVILYEKNISRNSPVKKLRGLVGGLQLAATLPLWIGIDEEGGRVNRLRPRYGFMTTRSAAVLGRRGASATGAQAARMARQMSSLGINLNFAPVVDLSLNARNQVIVGHGRSYGDEVDTVVLHARAFIEAHRAKNIATVVKHFPGHGSSWGDTHVGLTDITRSWQFKELLPYKDLAEGGYLDGVMTGHLVHGVLDSTLHPSTLSRVMLGDMLRGLIGYRGVIFSDDMQMGAIRDEYGLEESVFMAIAAGVDVLLFSNNMSEFYSAGDLHALIRRLVMEGRVSEARIRASYRRIMALKGRFHLLGGG